MYVVKRRHAQQSLGLVYSAVWSAVVPRSASGLCPPTVGTFYRHISELQRDSESDGEEGIAYCGVVRTWCVFALLDVALGLVLMARLVGSPLGISGILQNASLSYE